MKNKIKLNERIIFALDFADVEEAKKWVKRLDSKIKFFKVGLQLFLAGWWHIIDYIVDRGNKVMVDLKFFDIPETVYLSIKQLQNRGITFATVHGNKPIIEAAVKAKKELKILAVTVLTSFDESDMKEMGLKKSVKELVLLRAKKALELGCDGIVSSPLESGMLRKNLGSNFSIVTPGIRNNINLKTDDQQRVATAKQAIIEGSSYVVIGRPISTSKNPTKTIETFQNEIAEALN